MDRYRLKEVATALSWTPSRIEQWVSRGYIVPEHAATGGRSGRSWTFRDVLKLQLVGDLSQAGISMPDARSILDALPTELQGLFLIVIYWSGPHEIARIPLVGGDVLLERKPLRRSSEETVRIVRAEDLSAILAEPHLSRVIVINLENLEKRVRGALDGVLAGDPLAPLAERYGRIVGKP